MTRERSLLNVNQFGDSRVVCEAQMGKACSFIRFHGQMTGQNCAIGLHPALGKKSILMHRRGTRLRDGLRKPSLQYAIPAMGARTSSRIVRRVYFGADKGRV